MTATLTPQTALDDQPAVDTHDRIVVEGANVSQADQARTDTHAAPVGLTDPVLALLADALDDLERTRIANENRVRQLTRSVEDSDGETRGLGMDSSHPVVGKLTEIVEAMAAIEHQTVLTLQRRLRLHQMHPWLKAQVGIGEKQGARLLAALGDPYWNDLHGRPRLVSELWAYCGLHVVRSGGDADHWNSDTHGTAVGVAPSRKRGSKANWSADAKMRVYLVAESCIKRSDSPYRPAYDLGRAKYEGALHEAECKRCGPKSKPAQVGSELSKGHQHARAMRLVMKEILKEMWREARRLHSVED